MRGSSGWKHGPGTPTAQARAGGGSGRGGGNAGQGGSNNLRRGGGGGGGPMGSGGGYAGGKQHGHPQAGYGFPQSPGGGGGMPASAGFSSSSSSSSSSSQQVLVGERPPISTVEGVISGTKTPTEVASCAAAVVLLEGVNERGEGPVCDDGSAPAAAESVMGRGEPLKSEVAAPLDPAQRHQLKDSWTLFYDKRMLNTGKAKGEKQSYESNLQTVHTFDTVEDFWGVMHNIPSPTHVETSSNFHLFKTGIKPMWEDAANAEGGKWVLELRGVRESIDQIWLTIALDLISGKLDVDNSVTGIVLSRRKTSNKIAVWTKEKSNHNANMQIGTRVKEIIKLQPGSKAGLEYCHHTDSMRSGTSYTVQARITIPI